MTKKKPQLTVQLNVRITDTLNAQLEKAAFKAGLTKGALVAGTLKAYAQTFAEGEGK